MHRCTYNIPYDAPAAMLTKIFEALPEFRGYDASGIPFWFGFESEVKHLWASIEPSGLLVEGTIDDAEWDSWDSAMRRQATTELGYAVKDAEE